MAQSLILISSATGCVSILAFASMIGVPIGNASSGVGSEIYSVT